MNFKLELREKPILNIIWSLFLFCIVVMENIIWSENDAAGMWGDGVPSVKLKMAVQQPAVWKNFFALSLTFQADLCQSLVCSNYLRWWISVLYQSFHYFTQIMCCLLFLWLGSNCPSPAVCFCLLARQIGFETRLLWCSVNPNMPSICCSSLNLPQRHILGCYNLKASFCHLMSLGLPHETCTHTHFKECVHDMATGTFPLFVLSPIHLFWLVPGFVPLCYCASQIISTSAFMV